MKSSELARYISSSVREIYEERESKWIARIVMEYVTGKNEVDLIIHADDDVSDFTVERVEAIVAKLKANMPVQYAVGEARFYGYDFTVNSSTLIPRPETEELVDMIVKDAGDRSDLRVLDLGTGSGCIAIALALNLRFADVKGVDIDPDAVDTATYNAVKLHASATIVNGDMLRKTTLPAGPFDIIVSNPPYIAEKERADMEAHVTDYEPTTALFVPDDDPLKFYRAILDYCTDTLKPGGRLYFEINPVYSEDLRKEVESAGYNEVELHLDSFRNLRFLSAIRNR